MTTIDERSRHQLDLALEDRLGTEEADTMMNLLPPVGWAEVATKGDLAALEDRTELRFDKVDLRFEQIDQRFEQLERRFEQRFDSLDTVFATKADLHEALQAQSRQMIATMLGFSTLIVAVLALIIHL